MNGAYAFHALEQGAASVTGIDINPATREFNERNALYGNRVRFVQADVNDPGLPTRVGSFDVVFSSGVLYHVPNMLLTFDQLRRLCDGKLILATASVPERETPHAAVFLPYMERGAREELDYQHHSPKRGLDSAVIERGGYANWLWLPTASCLRAMLRFSGFSVEECFEHRRVTTILATAAPVETRWAPTRERARRGASAHGSMRPAAGGDA